jgi:Flp pilus assembly pilin Flp
MCKIRRRGKAVAQWVVVAGIIALALVAGVTSLGSRANTKLDQTATDVANPTSLTTRFGTSKGSGS